MTDLATNLTLDSREVAQMIEKNHAHLLREIETYKGYLIESKIGLNEFWQESTYKDSIGRTLKNYQITRKGCEFIAHKLTGKKGTVFTATYINKFHEMEQRIQHLPIIAKAPEPIQKLTYKGIPIITTRIISMFIGMKQGAIVYHAKCHRICYELLKDADIRAFVQENNLTHYCASRTVVFTKEAAILLLSKLNALTDRVKAKVDEYFALLPLAKPKELVTTKPTPKLYTDTPDNKKICEQIDRVHSFMDTLDLLMYQYKRHLTQEQAAAYRQVISLLGAELYNEVLDLSIMKPQLKELPGY